MQFYKTRKERGLVSITLASLDEKQKMGWDARVENDVFDRMTGERLPEPETFYVTLDELKMRRAEAMANFERERLAKLEEQQKYIEDLDLFIADVEATVLPKITTTDNDDTIS